MAPPQPAGAGTFLTRHVRRSCAALPLPPSGEDTSSPAPHGQSLDGVTFCRGLKPRSGSCRPFCVMILSSGPPRGDFAESLLSGTPAQNKGTLTCKWPCPGRKLTKTKEDGRGMALSRASDWGRKLGGWDRGLGGGAFLPLDGLWTVTAYDGLTPGASGASLSA